MNFFIISTFVYLNIMICESKHRLKNAEFGPKIVGGKSVALEKYPFAIQFFNLGALCGGVILNSWSILTSAHCLENNRDIEEMRVQIGSKYIYDFSAKKHELDSFVVHENYNKKIPFENDVAILFVKIPMKFNEVAKKAILVNHKKWMNAKEKRFIVTGWGWQRVAKQASITRDGKSYRCLRYLGNEVEKYHVPVLPVTVPFKEEQSDLAGDKRKCGFLRRVLLPQICRYRSWPDSYILTNIITAKYGGSLSELSLMMASLTYVPVKECSRLHGIELSEDMFCLYGDGERDTCRGDSGGGVLWHGRLVGLTSHGDGCAKKGKPSVYTNLWYLRGWIKKQVQKFIDNHCRQQKSEPIISS